MGGDGLTIDARAQLEARLLADRFEVVEGPLGWRCRSCRAEVAAPAAEAPDGSNTAVAIARLSEAAADHSLFCGRCND